MTKNQKVITGIVLGVVVWFGLSMFLNFNENSPKVKEIEISTRIANEVPEEVIKFTQEEEEEFVKQYAEKVLAFEDSSLLIQELDENIAKLSKDEAIQAIDGLMYVIYNDFNKVGFSEEFISVSQGYLDKGINLNDEEDVLKIEDKSYSEFVINLIKKGYCFPEIDGKVSFQIDFKKINNKYGKHIGTDFSDLLDFSQEQATRDYVNRETEKLDYDEVTSRILKTEILIEKYPESKYIQAFEESNHFYSQVYFGALDMNYVFDKEMKILDESLSHYNKVIKENPDTELSQKLKEYIAKLEVSDYKKTEDVQVFLLDLTGVDYEDIEGGNLTNIEEVMDTDEINENIKNVMKELGEKKKKDNN